MGRRGRRGAVARVPKRLGIAINGVLRWSILARSLLAAATGHRPARFVGKGGRGGSRAPFARDEIEVEAFVIGEVAGGVAEGDGEPLEKQEL